MCKTELNIRIEYLNRNMDDIMYIFFLFCV